MKEQQELENHTIHLQILLNLPSLVNHIKEIDQLLFKMYGEEYNSLPMLQFYNSLIFKLKELAS